MTQFKTKLGQSPFTDPQDEKFFKEQLNDVIKPYLMDHIDEIYLHPCLISLQPVPYPDDKGDIQDYILYQIESKLQPLDPGLTILDVFNQLEEFAKNLSQEILPDFPPIVEKKGINNSIIVQFYLPK